LAFFKEIFSEKKIVWHKKLFGDMFRKRLIQNSKLNIGYLFIGEKIELVYK